MIRSLWVYFAGVLTTLWVGGEVVLRSIFAPRTLREVCPRAPRRWSRSILRAAGTRVVLEGVEHLRSDGPQVLVANHESYFDVFALAAYLPVDYRFVAKEELARIPVFGRAWRACGHVSVNRQDRVAAVESLDEAGRRIREDNLTMIMFPEGTRSATGELGKFKKGAFVLALQMGVPLVPAAIHGSRHVMPRSGWPIRKGTIRIRIGPPIAVQGLTMADRDRLTLQARDEVARLKGELEGAVVGALRDTGRPPSAAAALRARPSH